MLLRRTLSVIRGRGFCVYRSAQKDIMKEININSTKLEAMRRDFKELRELQDNFMTNMNDANTVKFFKVTFPF